ncbi:MAG: glycoside hydrolase family 3 N-terminal domain-containing protein [Leifsonia flava]
MVGTLVRTTALALAVAVCLVGCAPSGTPAPTPSGSIAAEVPRRVAPDPVTIEARKRLAAMSLEQRIASMLMLHFPGTDAAAIAAQTVQYAPGGIILMGDNTAGGTAGVRAITAAADAATDLPLLVAVDQEGGEVSRIAEDPSPGADALRGQPASVTEQAFAARADVLADAGISVNFGIVADETDDPNSFLAGRVLGTDPASAAEHVAAAVAGEQGRVLSTLKHFPGHGAAPGDSHSSIPTTAESLADWRTTDAVPFRAGIDAGAELVMFGHLEYSAVDPGPASLSPVWHRILRDELGFDGIAISDDMGMLDHSGVPALADRSENAIAAITAGSTMVLYVPSPDASGAAGAFDPDALVADVAAAVRAGRIPAETIDRAAMKLLRARIGLEGV